MFIFHQLHSSAIESLILIIIRKWLQFVDDWTLLFPNGIHCFGLKLYYIHKIFYRIERRIDCATIVRNVVYDLDSWANRCQHTSTQISISFENQSNQRNNQIKRYYSILNVVDFDGIVNFQQCITLIEPLIIASCLIIFRFWNVYVHETIMFISVHHPQM